jgi:hypothetical protein
MASKLLEDLKKLRENLEKNTKKAPDYHIKTKVVAGSMKESTHQEKQVNDFIKRTPASPDNIKREIYQLIDYGFDNSGIQIAITDKLDQKYQTHRFKSITPIIDILNESTKRAKRIIFVFDKDYNTIYWENKGVQEIRIIIE